MLSCRPPPGVPEAVIGWVKDGKAVHNSSRVFITDRGDLHFKKTQSSDSGAFECLATNLAGTRRSIPADVIILEPPKFVVTPSNQTVNTGTNLVLPCEVSGFPKPRVDWVRLDGDLPASRSSVTGDSLELTSVMTSDTGHYACSAANGAGSIEAELFVTVLGFPQFVEKPYDAVMEIGREIKLNCAINGDPAPLVMWRLPGEDAYKVIMHETSTDKYTVDDEGALTINDLRFIDSGVYTCMGANHAGGIMAKSELLTVEAFPPPIIGIPPQDQVFKRGDTLKLPCVPVSEASEVTITWWHQPAAHLPTRQIHENQDAGIILSGNLALVIRNSNRTDSGIYTCRVKSRTGEIEATALVKYDENRATQPYMNIFMPMAPTKPGIEPINSTCVRVTWQANSNAPDKVLPTYMVEYWRHGWTEWRIARAQIRSEDIIVCDLKTNATYTFLVRSITENGQSFPSPWSDPIRLSTRNLWSATNVLTESTHTLLNASANSPSTVLLTWTNVHENHQEDGLLLYRISQEYDRSIGRDMYKFHVSSVLGNSTFSYLATDLKSFTKYTFFILPYWGAVEGTPSNSITIKTPGRVPSTAPQSVLLRSRGPRGALITWDGVELTQSPEQVTGYTVVTSCNGSVREHSVSTPWLELEDLSPGCLLTARVATVNVVGTGPFSPDAALQLASSSVIRSGNVAVTETAPEEAHATFNPMWLLYVLVPGLVLVIIVLVLYIKGLAYCQKASPRRCSQSCKGHEQSTMCSTPCHGNMYGDHTKSWQAIDSPHLQPNTCLLRPNHYMSEYADPNTMLVASMSPVGTYRSNLYAQPRGNYSIPGFAPPPPPSYPPPPILHSTADSTISSSNSSSNSRSSSRSKCSTHSGSHGRASNRRHYGGYKPVVQVDISDYTRPAGCEYEMYDAILVNNHQYSTVGAVHSSPQHEYSRVAQGELTVNHTESPSAVMKLGGHGSPLPSGNAVNSKEGHSLQSPTYLEKPS